MSSSRRTGRSSPRRTARARRAPDPRVPDKQYFRIGEVAAIADVETSVLRFWETEFNTLRPKKSKTNQRMYSRADVEHVLRIRDLLYEDGYTIAGARKQLRSGGRAETIDPAADPRTRAILERIRADVQQLLLLVGE